MFLQNYYTLKDAVKSRAILGRFPSVSLSLKQYNGNTTTDSWVLGAYDAFYHGIVSNTYFSYTVKLTPTIPTSTSGYSEMLPTGSTSTSYLIFAPYFRIVFGSGTTPPSLSDYTIESVISNISFLGSYVGGSDTQKTFTYSYQNNNGSEITINEVCIFGGVGGIGSYQNVVYSPTCATYREVFSTPLVVPAGGTFDYVITVVQNGNN